MSRLTILAILLVAGCDREAPPEEQPAEVAQEPEPIAAPMGDGVHGHHGHHAGEVHHDFSDVERFAKMFDDPERDAWQRPEAVVGLLAVEPGMTVADLGAGTGYFLPYLSPAVGEGGQVLALDVEPKMVAYMQQRASEQGWANVQAREVPADRPDLEPRSVDRVLVVNTWHHIKERVGYTVLLRGALKPGAAVMVVDFTAESPHGPPASERLSAETVVQELEGAGLRAEVVQSDLPWQYVVRAEVP